MSAKHRARITWSPEQVRAGLPVFTKTTDPSWFLGEEAGAEGWSLVCHFSEPPRSQGNPSLAEVRFLMPEAPHGRLTPGTALELFEPATQRRARVDVIE